MGFNDAFVGLTQGVGQGVKTLYELQKMQTLKTAQDQETAKFEMEMKQLEEAAKPRPIRDILMGLTEKAPKTAQAMLKEAMASGAVRGDSPETLYTTKNDLPALQSILKKYEPQLAYEQYLGTVEIRDNLTQKLKELQSKGGNEKQLAQLTAQKQQVDQKYEILFGKVVGFKEAIKGEDQGELQRKTRKFIDPSGVQRGQDYNFDPKTGEESPTGEPYQVAQDPNSDVNEGAVQTLANIFLQTGKFPSLGMGMGKLRGKALERVGEMMKQEGIDPMSLPSVQAEYTANSNSLNTVKKSYNQVMAFEKTASKNLDYALELSDKYPRAQFPDFNTFMQAVSSKTGGKEIEAFRQAVYAASMEYMKVITSGSGISSAELSVRAQQESEKILNAAKTQGQFSAIIDSMRVDMGNRQDAYLEQIAELNASLKPFRGKFNSGSVTPEQPTSKFKIVEVK